MGESLDIWIYQCYVTDLRVTGDAVQGIIQVCSSWSAGVWDGPCHPAHTPSTPFPVKSMGGMPASTSTAPSLLFYVQFPRAAPTPCSPRFLPSCSYRVPSQAGLQPGCSAFPGSYQALPFTGPAALPVHLSRNEGGGTVASRAFSMLTRNLFCTAAR